MVDGECIFLGWEGSSYFFQNSVKIVMAYLGEPVGEEGELESLPAGLELPGREVGVVGKLVPEVGTLLLLGLTIELSVSEPLGRALEPGAELPGVVLTGAVVLDGAVVAGVVVPLAAGAVLLVSFTAGFFLPDIAPLVVFFLVVWEISVATVET